MKKSYLIAMAASGMFGIAACADPASHQGDNMENTSDEVNPMPMTGSTTKDTLSEDSLNPELDTPNSP